MIIINEEKLRDYLDSKDFDTNVYDEILEYSAEDCEDAVYGVVHRPEDDECGYEFVRDTYDTYEEAHKTYKEYVDKNEFVILTQDVEIVLLENNV